MTSTCSRSNRRSGVVLFIGCILTAFPAFAQPGDQAAAADKRLTRFAIRAAGNEDSELATKAVLAIDKQFRQITDTLVGYRSRAHTIFQGSTVEMRHLMKKEDAFAEIEKNQTNKNVSPDRSQFRNDTIAYIRFHIGELSSWNYAPGKYPVLRSEITIVPDSGSNHFTQIAFGAKALNRIVKNLLSRSNRSEKKALRTYLENDWDRYSEEDKMLKAQPVRLRYLLTGDGAMVSAGLDIYGTHYLWTIDPLNGWKVTKVEALWIY